MLVALHVNPGQNVRVKQHHVGGQLVGHANLVLPQLLVHAQQHVVRVSVGRVPGEISYYAVSRGVIKACLRVGKPGRANAQRLPST